jgi:hypothetical protein
LAFLSLSARQPAFVLLVLFAPFRFTTGAGRPCPPRVVRPPISRSASLSLTPAASISVSLPPLPPPLASTVVASSLSPASVPLDLACGGDSDGQERRSLLQVVPASDRRRCRVSRNRSPPMPRGGRTVALAVYYRYYDYDYDYYHYPRRERYFLLVARMSGRAL